MSSEDVAGKQLRAAAKTACIKVQKLIKDREYEETKRRGAKSNSKNLEARREQEGMITHICLVSIDC